MIEMELQELSWDDIPMAIEEVSVIPTNTNNENVVTFSVSALAQEIQVDITSTYDRWSTAERYLTTNLALACLCHSGSVGIGNMSVTSEFMLVTASQTPLAGLGSHEGHECDECGGSIENGRCSKCGHAHHH